MNTLPSSAARDLAGIEPLDILEGAGDIAAYIYGDREKRRKVYHAVSNGGLPVFRIGGVISARRSTLLSWIADQEHKAAKAHAPPKTGDADDTNQTDEQQHGGEANHV